MSTDRALAAALLVFLLSQVHHCSELGACVCVTTCDGPAPAGAPQRGCYCVQQSPAE